MSNILDDLERVEILESTKSYVCKIRIAFGYKVFIQGAPDDVSWFEVDEPGNDMLRDKARIKAANFIQSTGVEGKKSFWSCAIKTYKDSVPTRFEWESDRTKYFPVFTTSYTHILKPALKTVFPEDNILGDHWVRMSMVPDPSGRTYEEEYDDKETGEKKKRQKLSLVTFPSERFANETVAKKASESSGEDSSSVTQPTLDSEIPDGWTKETISILLDSIKVDLKSGKSAAEIAKDYTVSVPFVLGVKNKS